MYRDSQRGNEITKTDPRHSSSPEGYKASCRPLCPQMAPRPQGVNGPPLAITQRTIRVDYHRFMTVGFLEWPTGGPSNWLAKWEDLIARAEQFNVSLKFWLTDVSTVWGRVPGLTFYFERVEMRVLEGKEGKYVPAAVSAFIQYAWDQMKEGEMVTFRKPRATRSAFSTQKVTFDGEEAPETAADASVPSRKKGSSRRGRKSGSRPQNTRRDRSRSRTRSPRPARSSRRQTRTRSPHLTRSSRRRSRSRTRSPRRMRSSRNRDRSESRSRSPRRSRPAKRDQRHSDRDPCSACGGKSHTFDRCFLVRGIEKSWIPNDSREMFKANMKKAAFKSKVEEYRADHE